jgi:ubiquinone/menaquinone biosynthesis C-methylase UbiE
MNRRQFFDQRAAQWDDRPDPRFHDLLKNDILPLFKLKKGQSVLDVGCGTGTLLPCLRAMTGKKASITGLDFSARMLEKAREKFGTAFTFVRASAEDMPFPTAAFDAVVSLNVFPHFPDKLKALKESLRVLKDGGKLIIAHTGSLREINAHHKKIGGPVAADLMPQDDVMMNLLAKAGFVKSKIFAGKKIHYMQAYKPRAGELPSFKPAAIRHVACALCCHCGGCAGKLL